MPTNAELVTEIVREASAPLTFAQIVERAVARKAFASKDPRNSIRAALSWNDRVKSVVEEWDEDEEDEGEDEEGDEDDG